MSRFKQLKVQIRLYNPVLSLSSDCLATQLDILLLAVLEQMRGYENIPRKRAKFLNFAKNSFNIRAAGVVEKVWDALEA